MRTGIDLVSVVVNAAIAVVGHVHSRIVIHMIMSWVLVQMIGMRMKLSQVSLLLFMTVK